MTRSARGRGIAAAFARQVFERHPGPWAVPFQNENPRAAAFWRRLAADVLDDVAEKTVAVPRQAAPAARRLAHRDAPGRLSPRARAAEYPAPCARVT